MHLGAGGSSKNYRTWTRVYCFCVSKRMQFHAVSLLTLFPLDTDNFITVRVNRMIKPWENRVLKGFFHQSPWNTRLVCAVAGLDCAQSINCICALASLYPWTIFTTGQLCCQNNSENWPSWGWLNISPDFLDMVCQKNIFASMISFLGLKLSILGYCNHP